MGLFEERLTFISGQPERLARWREEWRRLTPDAQDVVQADARNIARLHGIDARLAALAAVIRSKWGGAILTASLWRGWLTAAEGGRG